MLKIGQKVSYDPYAYTQVGMLKAELRKTVTAVATYVDHRHKWFLTEYAAPGGRIKVGFKFCDIGEVVTVIK